MRGDIAAEAKRWFLPWIWIIGILLLSKLASWIQTSL